MEQPAGTMQRALVQLEKSFGYTSFKSDLQKRAVLSITEGGFLSASNAVYSLRGLLRVRAIN